MAAAKARK